TVHVEEPTLPSNFAEKTFTFNVKHDTFYTSFEGACPDGWTLTGDWECGVPMNMANLGPATAYVGKQCLATQLNNNYKDNDPWSMTTATSPAIDLTNVMSPLLTFRMWNYTEGTPQGYYDGANLKISTDGGMNWTIINNVLPAYTTTLVGEAAW